MPPSARFVCFAGCGETHPLDAIVYRCSRCGSLLDVEHDLEALRATPPAAWTGLFDQRMLGRERHHASGVWSKLEWVLPEIAPESIVTFGEGRSHLLRAERHGASIGNADLRVKECGTSHTGSLKDLGMTVLVSAVNDMIRKGKRVRAIACASTGDTSAALAAYCAAAGLPALVLLPRDKISIAQLLQPIANGAKVFSLDTDFDGCMRVVQ